MSEIIIKSKSRVQKHGEVFTPRKIVNKMLDSPGIKECCENLTSTFLEPAVGEGAFLIVILERKLDMVAKKHNESLNQYENYSLLALSTIYGIELLEDNAQNCTMNLFQVFYEKYNAQLNKYGKSYMNPKVLDSAKLIIATNISQGNFLTRYTNADKPIIINEWTAINLDRKPKIIKIIRTEYTLDEIYQGISKELGEPIIDSPSKKESEQLSFFDDLLKSEKNTVSKAHYVPSKIIDVYKEEMEEVNED
ncbi:N-6 DNA methylase [Staphylococcus shinii]|uniref:N-6 DNA methylase n=1 Tax=Staphylococcus shinii TaxID=2912228 RepID=UPI000C32993F|nr:N-6 DNA methylase [Staphylococcus shinii]PKI09560.1 methylase [Staphylococcus shinii]